jgi:hypothetical protein
MQNNQIIIGITDCHTSILISQSVTSSFNDRNISIYCKQKEVFSGK